MSEQRDELVALVIKQIVEDASTRCFAINMQGLLRDVSDTSLEDFLSDEVVRAYWEKYPVR